MSKWNGKALLKRKVDLTTDSDASLSGWGATCGDQRTGGPWSSQERHMHINCLELLAATLAVQTFTKNLKEVSVLMRIDNTTAVAYVNHKGGTASQELVDLTKNLWMWCLERNVVLTAQHLPGVLNQIADSESRKVWDQTDWKLSTLIFGKINQLYGPIQVDLFATRLTNQVPTFFSWKPDPYAVGTDAFLQDWAGLQNGYANPPVCLIGRILSQVKAQQTQIILVAPVWKAQPWYPAILEMLTDYPRIILENPLARESLVQPSLPQLAVCNISGRDTLVRSFRRKLQHCYSSRGDPKLTNLTTHSLGNGVAGVWNGVPI